MRFSINGEYLQKKSRRISPCSICRSSTRGTDAISPERSSPTSFCSCYHMWLRPNVSLSASVSGKESKPRGRTEFTSAEGRWNVRIPSKWSGERGKTVSSPAAPPRSCSSYRTPCSEIGANQLIQSKKTISYLSERKMLKKEDVNFCEKLDKSVE